MEKIYQEKIWTDGRHAFIEIAPHDRPAPKPISRRFFSLVKSSRLNVTGIDAGPVFANCSKDPGNFFLSTSVKFKLFNILKFV